MIRARTATILRYYGDNRVTKPCLTVLQYTVIS